MFSDSRKWSNFGRFAKIAHKSPDRDIFQISKQNLNLWQYIKKFMQ